MNEKEKKIIENIENDLAIISGGIQGLASGESNSYVKESLFEKSYSIQESIGKLEKLRKKR